MIYTGYKFSEDEMIIKESNSRLSLEADGYEYIASTARDRQYYESCGKRSDEEYRKTCDIKDHD